jgi:hypothetical protein
MASPDNPNPLVRSQLKAVPAQGCEWLPHLLQHTLEKSGQGGLAQGLTNRKEMGRLIAGRNLYLLGEFSQVLQRLQTAGVRVIVLKGAALCERVYPHLGVRTFADLDLLIPGQDFPKVRRILMTLGFQPGYVPLRPGDEDFQGQATFEKPGLQPVIIEPHWSLGLPYPYISGTYYLPGLWERAVKATVAGVETRILSPEDFLLHLCLHLFQNRQIPFWLVSACDIAEFAHCYQQSLDWQAFLQRAQTWKVTLPVRFALEKTLALFQPPIPGQALRSLDSYKPGYYERLIFTLLSCFR